MGGGHCRTATDSEKFHLLLLLPIIASMRETGIAILCKDRQEWEILTDNLNMQAIDEKRVIKIQILKLCIRLQNQSILHTLGVACGKY